MPIRWPTGHNVSCACCSPIGAGVTRRETLDQLARGGLAALLASGGLWPAPARADDDVVRIGYLPITDATALLVAHAKGFFEEDGLEAERADADPRLVAAGRGLRRRQVQPRRTC